MMSREWFDFNAKRVLCTWAKIFFKSAKRWWPDVIKLTLSFFGVIARNIWLCMNSVVHGGEFVHPSQLANAP
jgi:hypothetical protein